MITNEEIQSRLKEIEDGLAQLPDEKSLTGKQRGERYSLLLEKDALEKIKKGRDKQNYHEEVNGMLHLAAVKAIKNPFLRHLAQIKFKNNIFS